MLAVPPGYATVIWPPSGLSMGWLILRGQKYWPGILLGSFVTNCLISAAYTPSTGVIWVKVLAAFFIAAGSTVQASVGKAIVRRFFGIPINLQSSRDVVRAILLAGPLSCVLAATCGVGTLVMTGIMPVEVAPKNWITWWLGDTLGVLAMLPPMLFIPVANRPLRWKGQDVESVPVLAIGAVLLSFLGTLFIWHTATVEVYRQGKQEFESLARDNEQAIVNRLTAYQLSLAGCVGFVRGSQNVSRTEWQTYVDGLDIPKNYPGMLGLGLVDPVKREAVAGFERAARGGGDPNFKVHPKLFDRNYVVRYLEPAASGNPALGLNLAYESKRREAVETAIDSGQTIITRHVILVQDESKTPGFLLVSPIYAVNSATSTVAERRAALRALVYAPFRAGDFLESITKSQGRTINVRLYDGDQETPEDLIFSDKGDDSSPEPARFVVGKTLHLMGRDWRVVWSSTRLYEHLEANYTPNYLLVLGLTFTGLLALFFVISGARQADSLQYWTLEDKFYLLPFVIFFVCFTGAGYLYRLLEIHELENVSAIVQADASKISRVIGVQNSERFQALGRMAQRWTNGGGMPEENWRKDARNYTLQMDGLEAVEWVDSQARVRWTEPTGGLADRSGSSLMTGGHYPDVLKHAATGVMAFSKPVETSPGFWTARLAVPIRGPGGINDGFIVGVFSIRDMLDSLLQSEVGDDYLIQLSDAGTTFYRTSNSSTSLDTGFSSSNAIRVGDRVWHLRVTPSKELAHSKHSSLPSIVLFSGALVGFLLGVAVRATFVSRMKTLQIRTREEQLVASNSLNSAILNSAAALIIATDTEGKIVVFNRAAERALGYRREEIIGKATPALWHDPEEITQRAAQLSLEFGELVSPGFEVFVRKPTSEGVESREWTFIRRTKSRFPVNLTVTALRDGKNQITGFLGVIEDISERKRQQQILEASEETFRSAMEHAAIGMALVSTSGRFINVNQALCELLGYSREELLQLSFQDITFPDDLDQDLDYLRAVLDGEITNYQMEKRYVNKRGQLVWTLLSVSLARDAAGQPSHFIAQIQDISHAKEMERLKNEFVSMVSHELRTPLTSIRGSLGLISGVMTDEISERAANLVGIALKNIERLVLLINDILDIDKIASGQMQFQISPQNLAGLLEQVSDSNAAFAERYGAHILVAPADPAIEINVDASRFVQILTNLVSNAAKFSPSGGQVEVFTELKASRVRISVRDHGSGIPEEFRARIFGKFSQADASVTRSKGGSGLGLHISRQLTEHMGGEIGFDSIVGEGSTFWVEFPIFQPKSPGSEIPILSRSVLIFDEDQQASSGLAQVLRQTGFEVTRSHDSAEVRGLIGAGGFAALLLNLDPPRGEALRLLREIRSHQGHPSIPVIAFAVRPGEVAREINGEALAVVDWLEKPIETQTLVRSLRLVLKESGALKRILHIEDDEDLIHVLTSATENEATIDGATTLARAEAFLKVNHYDLIILDIAMPDGSGLALLERLQEFHAETTPVVILSASETPAEVQRRVAGAMVKSRMSEAKIVATILDLVQPKATAQPPESISTTGVD